MAKVRIYRFKVYDIQHDEAVTSKRWGTEKAIKEIACGQVLQDTGVEVDGNSHAMKFEYDQIRTAYLRRFGYRVLRFSNSRVMLETPAVLRSIERHLAPRKS